MANSFLERLDELNKKYLAEYRDEVNENDGLYLFQEKMKRYEELQDEYWKLYTDEGDAYQDLDVDDHNKFLSTWNSRYERYRKRMVDVDKILRVKQETWDKNNVRINKLNQDIENNNVLIESKKSRIESLEKIIEFKKNAKYRKYSTVEIEMDEEMVELLKSQVVKLENYNAKSQEEIDSLGKENEAIMMGSKEKELDETNDLVNPMGEKGEEEAEKEPEKEPEKELIPLSERPQSLTDLTNEMDKEMAEDNNAEDEKAVEEKPVEEEKPAEEKPAEEKPAEEKPAEEEKVVPAKRPEPVLDPIETGRVVSTATPKNALLKALTFVIAGVVGFLSGLGLEKLSNNVAEKAKNLNPTPTPKDTETTVNIDIEDETKNESEQENTQDNSSSVTPDTNPTPVPQPEPQPEPEPSMENEKVGLAFGETIVDEKVNADGSKTTVEHNYQGQSITTQTDQMGNQSEPVIGNVESTKYVFNGHEFTEVPVPDANQAQFNRTEGVPFEQFAGTPEERNNAMDALLNGDPALQEGASKTLVP